MFDHAWCGNKRITTVLPPVTFERVSRTLNGDLEIVYEDEVLVAINKPAGLLVHRSPIDKHETRFAVQRLRNQMGKHVYPVHRLDKPTSGLLLFTFSPVIARIVAEQFEARTVNKGYQAIVRGHAPDSCFIDHALKDETDHAGKRLDGRSCSVAREAQTSLTTLRRWTIPFAVDRYPTSRYSLVQLSPHTGRHRQLRRHLKHIAHPIVGDTRYGKGTHNRFFRDAAACHRLLLASVSLTLNHPVSGRRLAIQTSPDESFNRVINWLDASHQLPSDADVIRDR